MKAALMLTGALIFLPGVIFFLQGIGVIISASPMTNDPKWAVIGVVMAIIGAVIFVYGLRQGGQSSSTP